MAGRRHSTPLFEIVSRNGNGTVAPAPTRLPESGEKHVEPKPTDSSPTPAPVSAPSPAARPTREPDADLPRTMGRISVAAGTVRLPLNYLYIGASAILLIVLGTWTLAYFFGSSAAEERARREIESATGTPREVEDGAPAGSLPANQPARQTPGGNSPTSENNGTSQTPPRPTPVALTRPDLPAITPERTRFLAASGFFASEPRIEGMNYLCLVARLPEEDAARALDFLARNAVAAVGVENERSTPNNRTFALYTLVPISSEAFRDSQDRTAHDGLMAELGRRWRAEERGTSDFSRPQWYRFRPE